MLRRDEVLSNLSNISPRYNFMLDLLLKAEGGYLHRNKGEVDITNGYGIYRGAHRTAKVFEYIDSVARSLDEDRPSHVWEPNVIKLVNSKIDPAQDRWYSYLFYKHYYRVWDFDRIPMEVIPVVISIFANAPKMFCKAYQRTVNGFIANGHIKGAPLVVDGAIGPKSMAASAAIFNLGPEAIKDFKNLLLNSCIDGYRSIVAASPAKNIYLRGWINRVEGLRRA